MVIGVETFRGGIGQIQSVNPSPEEVTVTTVLVSQSGCSSRLRKVVHRLDRLSDVTRPNSFIETLSKTSDIGRS